jgi:hypothetical protein
MMEYWITTHWPTPDTEPGQSRHVFVKQRNVTLPNPGDFVFIRESISARAHGKPVKTITRHHRGQQEEFEVPKGYGGIIGTAIVQGTLRKQQPEDVVFDFGDLREWMVIPCHQFEAARLPLHKLLALLSIDEPIKSVRFLSLWRLPADGRAEKLLQALRR